ncbi:MAG: hypothetical protein PF444_03975 [Bacteroidales bacterium]|jgi:hypothetical protein|nr:hypothetical protein [Bacteroidales bacterium]
MTAREKKRKVAMIAVSYYLEQEAETNSDNTTVNSWKTTAREIAMSNRTLVQRRGRLLS